MYTHPTLNCNQYSHFIERWLRRFPLTLRLISTPMISRRGLVPVSYTSNLLGDKAFVIRSYHSILSLNNTFKQYRIWESYRFIIIPPSRHICFTYSSLSFFILTRFKCSFLSKRCSIGYPFISFTHSSLGRVSLLTYSDSTEWNCTPYQLHLDWTTVAELPHPFLEQLHI